MYGAWDSALDSSDPSERGQRVQTQVWGLPYQWSVCPYCQTLLQVGLIDVRNHKHIFIILGLSLARKSWLFLDKIISKIKKTQVKWLSKWINIGSMKISSKIFMIIQSPFLVINTIFLVRQDGPYSHDIALLKLKPKGDGCGARYNPTVSPICLPDPWATFHENTTCLVSGWGKTKSETKL